MKKNECQVEVFSRVTGFFRPVQSWNKGKTAEFKDRQRFAFDTSQVETSDDNSRVTESISG